MDIVAQFPANPAAGTDRNGGQPAGKSGFRAESLVAMAFSSLIPPAGQELRGQIRYPQEQPLASGDEDGTAEQASADLPQEQTEPDLQEGDPIENPAGIALVRVALHAFGVPQSTMDANVGINTLPDGEARGEEQTPRTGPADRALLRPAGEFAVRIGHERGLPPQHASDRVRQKATPDALPAREMPVRPAMEQGARVADAAATRPVQSEPAAPQPIRSEFGQARTEFTARSAAATVSGPPVRVISMETHLSPVANPAVQAGAVGTVLTQAVQEAVSLPRLAADPPPGSRSAMETAMRPDTGFSRQTVRALEIELTPQEMGKLRVRITVEQGRIAVEISASSLRGHAMMAAGQEGLARALAEAGAPAEVSVRLIAEQTGDRPAMQISGGSGNMAAAGEERTNAGGRQAASQQHDGTAEDSRSGSNPEEPNRSGNGRGQGWYF